MEDGIGLANGEGDCFRSGSLWPASFNSLFDSDPLRLE